MLKYQIGNISENKAIAFLISNKYKIIEKNFRAPHNLGEIDIVALDRKDNCLCFIEVRSKNDSSYGLPQETITADKKRKLVRTIKYYLQKKTTKFQNYRIDLIAISNTDKIVYIKNAFQIDEIEQCFL